MGQLLPRPPIFPPVRHLQAPPKKVPPIREHNYFTNAPCKTLKCEYCGRLYRGEVLECPGCRAPVSIVADVRRPRQEPRARPINPGGSVGLYTE